MDTYLFTEEDESKLVELAQISDWMLRNFFRACRVHEETLEYLLARTRETQRSYAEYERQKRMNNPKRRLEELMTPGYDGPHNAVLPKARELFRNYDALKNLFALTVIVSEAGVEAEKKGMKMKVLAPRELLKASSALEKMPAVVAYIEEQKENMRKAAKYLDKAKVDPELYEGVMNKINAMAVKLAPFAVFGDRYACLVRKAEKHNMLAIFGPTAHKLIFPDMFYNTNLIERKGYFDGVFGQSDRH